ncbi:iron-containing superoxide dismutase [Tieghemostelium lacteum]|uniref:Superoxide dismutase n=1 Tax=Tieghemostelium lacteum TaxID=361077 RepID=A0A151Z4K7_TIELA|nr:iron-containing superoxide dismutase [Tieghemostelium lacteum]|eukprot:KYQ88886.1 iron-containing superoxide dismutase [Tieghemostelium lacteum]
MIPRLLNSSKCSLVIKNTIERIQIRGIYTIPDVPYSKRGIENFLSAKSIQQHLQHHKTDVEKANNLVLRTPWEHTTINQAISQSFSNKEDAQFFNAVSSHFNHSFFWRSITDSPNEITAHMLKAIEIDFGSFKIFQQRFSQNASALNGQGYTWLVFHDKTLKIINTFDSGSPLELRNCYPLLCLDLFEHSYLLDYDNNKNKYIANFWNVINWEFVESKFLNALIYDREYKLKIEDLVMKQATREEINEIKKGQEEK